MTPYQPLLMHHGPTVQATANLLRCAYRQPDTTVAKQRRRGAAVTAKIKVDVGAVLIRVRGRLLAAQGVALAWAQVVDHDHNRVARVGELVAAAVGLRGQAPAGAAGGSGALREKGRG
jgi:hypothetical protein